MSRGFESRPAGPRIRVLLPPVVLVAVALAGIAVSAASGDSAGPASPSAAVEDASFGTVSWQNPGQATTSNNLYSQTPLNAATSRYLKLTRFGFSVPAGATIDGIVVNVERNVSGTSGAIRDASVRLVKGGSVTGADRADTATSWPWSTTRDFTAAYGSATDRWGTTLTPADVSSTGFGVAIAAKNPNSANTFAKVDSVTIAVSYTIAVAAPATPPTNTSPPAVSGTPQPGQTLTSTPGLWSGTAPIGFGYQWRGCDSVGASCSDVAGATSSSYTVASGDVGSTLRVRVTATNSAGSATADSPAGAAVTIPTPPANTSAPPVLGTAQAGGTLTASPGTWTGTAPIAYAYQWAACDSSGSCSDIAGATSSSYSVANGDVGSTLLVHVRATNSVGSSAADSAATAAVIPPPPPANTSPPSVSGTAQVTQTLSASPGTWSGVGPIDYSYQWAACDSSGSCSNIDGATSSTYTVASGDVGSTLLVRVTATNAGGPSTADSAATAAVTPPVPPSNTSPPAVTGIAQAGQTLTASPGLWSGTGPIGFSYHWAACDPSGSCSDIGGATSSTYTVTTTEVGSNLRVHVTAANTAGSAGSDSTPTAAVLPPPSSSPASAPAGPSTAVEDASFGTAYWQNPGYATTSNNVYAQTALKSATSRYLKLTGFRFSVPAGATISGVTVSVERNLSGTSGDVRDASVRLVKGGSVTGVDRADTATTWPWSTSRDFTATYGSGSDRWGTTLTPADVNSAGFGVAIAAKNLSSANTFAKVDSVTIALSYGGGLSPSSTAAPALSGLAQTGRTLTASPGTWSGTTPMGYGYQWRRCDSGGGSCSDIGGATSSTYTVATGDIGSRLRVRVTAANTAGWSAADSAATDIVSARGGVTDVSATGYYSRRIYDPPDAPYTAWTGAWRNPDGSLWTAFTQSQGTMGTGTPQWARDLLGSFYVASRDHWDLTNTTVYMRSTDHGRTWSVQQPLGAGVDDVMVTPDAVGNAGDASDCALEGLGSGCPVTIPIGYTPQADIALPDGTLLRRVNGEDIRYDRAVAATAFIQRLAPGATSWTGAQYLLDPATYTYQISRIRQLSDGRLIALGQVWDAPAGTRTNSTPLHHLLMVSSDQGATWTGGALTLGPGVTEPPADEWDAAELPSGDLLAVFRTTVDRKQGLLTKDGAGWTLTKVTTPPFGYSGHPELLADPGANAVVYVATNDSSGQKGIWYLPYGDAQAGGNNWTLLPFTSYNGDLRCRSAGSAWNCSSLYYPRTVEDVDGTIVVLSHNGADDPYPPSNESIFVQTFKLAGGAFTTYEAESPANTTTGGAAVAACTACSAGAKVTNVGNGGTLTFNRVNVAVTGTYQVKVSYTDGSDAGRQADVSVNGGPAQTVSFTPTGGADTPGTLTVTLQLAAGSNTIAFGNSADLAPGFDKIDVPATPG